MHALWRIVSRAGLVCVLACAVMLAGLPGCTTPNLTGAGRFHDVNEIRVGMSPNEVRRVMGTGYKEVWEESMRGMFMGNYAWDYPEGRVYFNTDGVTKVVPYK